MAKVSNEEKVASKMVALVNDYTLDLDMVGIYIARQSPILLFNRLQVISESADFEMEAVINEKVNHVHRAFE
jgi:hypothetical protein